MKPPPDPDAPAPRPERTGLFSNDLARLMSLCALVGVASGLGAIAFYWGLEAVHHFTVVNLAGYHPTIPGGELAIFPESHAPFRPWVLFLLPAVGGLVSGFIVYKFAPEAAGEGADAAIESYHTLGGPMRKRVPAIKIVASSIMIGTGGSGGREGPIAQIGSGLASIVAAQLKLSPTERRTLMAAGMAAGIGSIFHAPLAGAIFAAEILYRGMDFEHEVLVPAFISSIISYTVFCTMFGWTPVFATPDFVFHDPLQLVPYLLLAVVVALGAMIFIKLYGVVHRAFQRMNVSPYFKPAIGGLGVGLFAFFLPEAMGTGYGVIQDALNGKLGIGLLLAVAAGKMITTSFSVGSGGSGGAFGPSVVIGGALGGAVGQVAAYWLPTLNIEPGAFVLVGMAGFFAGAANCPISTIIMVSEMTGNYHLLVPSMLVCIVSYVVAQKVTIYEKQLPSRLEAPTKMGNMLAAVLKRLTVRQSLEMQYPEKTASAFETHPEGMPDNSRGVRPKADTPGVQPSKIQTTAEGSGKLPAASTKSAPSLGPIGPTPPTGPTRPTDGPVNHRSGTPQLYPTPPPSLPFPNLPPLITIPESMPLSVMIHRLAEADQTTFPVVDIEGRMIGVVDWEDVRRVLADEDTIADLIVARDMAREPVTISPDDSLLTAIRKMNRADTTELIVVDPSAPDRALATLSHNCVMRTYDEALLSSQPPSFSSF